jgi:hypothetical protein
MPEAVKIRFQPVPARAALCVLAAVAALLLPGCGTPAADGGAGDDSTPLERTVSGTPGLVRMRLSASHITIAERLELELSAEHDARFTAELPQFGEKLEQFGIVDYRTTPPRLNAEGDVVVSRSYVLEPFLSGTYTIPPMAVRFLQAEDPDADPSVLETEAVTVTVDSLLPEDLEGLDIEDIAPPVTMPRKLGAWVWATAGLAAAGLVLALAVRWFERRAREQAAAPPPPAHELAYAELQALVAEDLIGRGRIKPFYHRLSGILRRYIERRFGLHAPERTTEEFLEELRSGQALARDHREQLSRFLTHCDLVKFAEHEPTTAEIQRTFDACKAFIETTKSEAPALAQPAAPPDRPGEEVG